MISSKRDEISAALDFGFIGTADALDRSRFQFNPVGDYH